MWSTVWVILWLGAILAVQGNRTHMAKGPGVLENRLLSRRVRGLVFPDKASILLTAALTKIIVGGRPSGLQYSLEFDMYVPLPDTVEGWQPKILKRLKPKPTPKRRWDWSHYQRPASSYSYETPSKTASIARDPLYQTQSKYWGPYKVTSKARDSFYQGKTNSWEPYRTTSYASPAFNRDSFYQTPWYPSSPVSRKNAYEPEEEVYESWAQVPSWKLNRGYRERREIFDQFEALGKVFQLDLRSCIKRAMCELRARLNAGHDQGFLMDDLVRIVLTVPEEIADRKYRHRMDVQDCARFYAPSCPYKVLDFLTPSAQKI
ncbi:uncharacterized protein [Drosophila kikkawai]|uniref:Uncharacterized protein n=1 Tax=Drosophila kikkawai TaxID=30033 RepID=A0A6P4IBG4_DROKI|nr:uncharacterized protein LOC108073155 [Drosophila kikkawai]